MIDVPQKQSWSWNVTSHASSELAVKEEGVAHTCSLLCLTAVVIGFDSL
jgi:hypothetical protein